MTTSVVTETKSYTLPSFKVQVVAEVYSDEPIRNIDAYFYGTLGNVSQYWKNVDTLGDQGILIESVWVTVPGGSSVEEAVAKINPGFYDRNTRVSYKFENV